MLRQKWRGKTNAAYLVMNKIWLILIFLVALRGGSYAGVVSIALDYKGSSEEFIKYVKADGLKIAVAAEVSKTSQTDMLFPIKHDKEHQLLTSQFNISWEGPINIYLQLSDFGLRFNYFHLADIKTDKNQKIDQKLKFQTVVVSINLSELEGTLKGESDGNNKLIYAGDILLNGNRRTGDFKSVGFNYGLLTEEKIIILNREIRSVRLRIFPNSRTKGKKMVLEGEFWIPENEGATTTTLLFKKEHVTESKDRSQNTDIIK